MEIFLYDKATMSYCGCKIAQYFFFSFIIDHQKNPNFDRQYLSNPWSDFDKNYTKFLLLISSSNILVMKQHQNIFFFEVLSKKDTYKNLSKSFNTIVLVFSGIKGIPVQESSDGREFLSFFSTCNELKHAEAARVLCA